jgi:micrococcal nuclease
MRKWLWFLTMILIASVILSACGASKSVSTPGREQVKVERVVDGDTFEIQRNGKKEKVRMIGVDTPETKKPGTPVMYYGKEASEYTKSRLEKKSVELEWDVDKTDQYGRFLAYVWIGDELFNRTLIQEGYARVYTFPPNVKYVDQFTKDQTEARKKQKGLWTNYDKAFDK